MNRSQYVHQTAFPPSPYNPQSYGAVPQPSQMQGMAPHPNAVPQPGYSNPTPSIGQSPIQPSVSPNTMWTANFANGPIIEDLCAPPPPMGIFSASPPMNAFPPGMAMGPMHPGSMPQVQTVYGIRHHPFAVPGMLPPGQGAPMQGIPSTRVLGTYPPYTGQQHGYAYPGRPMDPSMNAMLARPRLETGFPHAVPPAPPGNAAGMGHMSSPHMEGSPGGDAMPPLTPVEEALREFLSPDLGELGRS
ncbi:hypothetical protein N657DRAFT_693966 [Parathielavia appendiculata]|uniref:Uncharacterized protein n=1 Tax=Parathielavia appendiculata TaxID=2587402 RepID=A0AAN6TR40_9PEZI|nr:hypothetical protein N657DRAFT_693966 [Parathielavia appendiculata]